MQLSLKTWVLLTALLQTPAPVSGVRISGRVVDSETGKPLANATVTLSNQESKRDNRTIVSGPNGAFQFLNVPRGAYRLQTSHPMPVVPYRSESVEFSVADRNLDDIGLILSPAVSKIPIAGKIVMTAGTPAQAISALLLSTEVIPVQRDGTFELRLRPAQEYTLALQNAPEGYYIESVSAGIWDAAKETWIVRDKPSTPVQIVLGAGRQRITGRILSARRTPAAQAAATLTGPSPSTVARPLTLGPDGGFALGGLRAGDYELRAKAFAGDATQTAALRFTLGTQSREGMELVLKEMIAITGQLVAPGNRTIDELMKFSPGIEIEDATGRRRVAADSTGRFQFRSFDGDFTVSIRNLPLEFRQYTVTTGPASVTVRVGPVLGDGPGGRVPINGPQIK